MEDVEVKTLVNSLQERIQKLNQDSNPQHLEENIQEDKSGSPQ